MATTATHTAPDPAASPNRQVSPDWLLERARANIRIFKTLRRLSDEQIAKTAGFSSRQVVSHRLSGRSDMSSEDFARFAAALKIEPHVLLLRTDEALRWSEDNPGYKPPKYARQKPMVKKRNGLDAARAQR